MQVICWYNLHMSIRDHWIVFQESLERSADRFKRDVSTITVMAVSKTRSLDEIIEARAAGLNLFGENRIEEASEKFAELDSDEYPLCLIGHLQSNKVNKIDARYKGVHSVDSLKIANRLSIHRDKINSPLEILLQVNTSGEDSKSGFADSIQLCDAAAEIAEMPSLNLRGLMTMAPFIDDERIVRSCFSTCREWSEVIKIYVIGEPILSMGMSSDFEWAVAEGSTLLRIGTTLFGGR
jgi:pyridoxal phosphate enzyme (YggS family)